MVFLDDVFEQQSRLIRHGFPHFRCHLRKELRVKNLASQISHPQPLSAEPVKQSPSTRVLEEPLYLSSKNFGMVELPLVGKSRQFGVRWGCPE